MIVYPRVVTTRPNTFKTSKMLSRDFSATVAEGILSSQNMFFLQNYYVFVVYLPTCIYAHLNIINSFTMRKKISNFAKSTAEHGKDRYYDTAMMDDDVEDGRLGTRGHCGDVPFRSDGLSETFQLAVICHRR